MSSSNIYQSPSTDPALRDSQETLKNDIIKELSFQSTWVLLILSLLTLGIYSAHYIQRQTKILNKYLPLNKRISASSVTSITVLSYISAALFFPYMYVEDGHFIETISDTVDFIWWISLLVWAFKANSCIHEVLGSLKGGPRWFHSFWTFLLTDLYFNYKVNSINRLA